MRAIDSVTWKVGVNALHPSAEPIPIPLMTFWVQLANPAAVLPETQNPDVSGLGSALKVSTILSNSPKESIMN